MWWEVFFMLVVLKIPVVYLCAIVWWAIRAEPGPLEEALPVTLPALLPPGTPARDRRAERGRPQRPGPTRGRAGTRRRTTYARKAER